MKPNPVVHFEMGYEDRDRMAKFYQSTFGWKTQMMGEEMGNYVLAQTAETDAQGMVQQKGAINGGFYHKTTLDSQAPSIVISVDDITAAVQAVTSNGGKILGGMTPDGGRTMEPTEIPGVGMWISAQDTEGNQI